jgi:thiol-disulfide isomerase/thioredoxin
MKSLFKPLPVIGALLLVAGGAFGLLSLSTSSGANPPAYRQAVVAPAESVSKAVLFFWYGCPHCKRLEEKFRQEHGTQQINLSLGAGHAGFEKVPAPINDVWELHARLFYALSHAGVSDETHWKVMNVILDEGLNSHLKIMSAIPSFIDYEKSLNPGFSADPSVVSADLYSPATDAAIARAKRLVAQLGVVGVPTMLVNQHDVLELGRGLNYDDILPETLRLLKLP